MQQEKRLLEIKQENQKRQKRLEEQQKRQKQETSREVDRKNGIGSFKSYSKENFTTMHVDAAAIAIINGAEINGF